MDEEQQNLASLDSQHAHWQGDIAKMRADIKTLREQIAALQALQTPEQAASDQKEVGELNVKKRDATATVSPPHMPHFLQRSRGERGERCWAAA